MTATAQAVPGEVMSLTERELMRRMIIRLMPIVTIIYLIAIIDRSNIGFAKLQMTQDLHMSEAVYGFGASLFFIGYLVFEIRSAWMACSHHALLGHCDHPACFRLFHDDLLHLAAPARHCRGGLLSRAHLLHQLVVSAELQGRRCRRSHARQCVRQYARLVTGRAAARSQWHAGARGVAMGVPGNRCARRDH